MKHILALETDHYGVMDGFCIKEADHFGAVSALRPLYFRWRPQTFRWRPPYFHWRPQVFIGDPIF